MTDATPSLHPTMTDKDNRPRFPAKYAWINAGAILIIALIDSREPGWLVLQLLGIGLVLSLLLLVQWLLWLGFHRWIRSRTVWAVFLLLPCVLVALDSVWWAIPRNRAESALRAGRLAKLPSEAREIKHHAWSGFFTGSQFVTFTASPDEVNAFVARSPSLANVRPSLFSKKRHRLPYPERDSDQEFDGHDYYPAQTLAPAWWNGTLRDSGRVYAIPADKGGHNYGTLIYDEIRGVVYIQITWS